MEKVSAVVVLIQLPCGLLSWCPPCVGPADLGPLIRGCDLSTVLSSFLSSFCIAYRSFDVLHLQIRRHEPLSHVYISPCLSLLLFTSFSFLTIIGPHLSLHSSSSLSIRRSKMLFRSRRDIRGKFLVAEVESKVVRCGDQNHDAGEGWARSTRMIRFP